MSYLFPIAACIDGMWSVENVLTFVTHSEEYQDKLQWRSTDEHQLKLRQKRQNTSIQAFGRNRPPQHALQSPTHVEHSLTCQETQKKDKEIQHLTRQLDVTSKELQDTINQQIDVIRTLQEDLLTKERQLQQLRWQLLQKQQLITDAQQTQATLQREHENRERLLQQQLEDQLERNHQQLLDSQERERVLRQERDQFYQQGYNTEKELKETTTALQQTQKINNTLQKQIQHLQDQSYWVVSREEIEMTEEVLGKGGWGEVKVAKFRGLRVAAKFLHEVILSPYNISVFTREMEIAARVRHPNLLQFIGATRVGTPIILSELMPTNLHKELNKSSLNHPQIIKIAKDISAALNYLHLWQPHPILHRDVSSPNVLLEPSGSEIWKARLCDYGSANLVQSISVCSVAPGNPFYSAPEAPFPDQHSPAMDVFSFGVLLMEMTLCQPPASKSADKMTQSETIQWPAMKHLVQRCISNESQFRPSITEVLTDLEHM